MFKRHLHRTALTTTLLLSCFAAASAQEPPPPLNIERVPLITIQINNKDAATPKSTGINDKTTTTNTTGKATKPTVKAAAPAKAAPRNKATASATVKTVPGDNASAGTTSTSESSGNITNITTHNNSVTYNITNNVSGMAPESKYAPAIMLNVSPDLQPDVKALSTPATIVTPPPPPPTPAPAVTTDQALPDDSEDYVIPPLDDEQMDPQTNDDFNAELGIEPGEEVVAPEALPAAAPAAITAPQAPVATPLPAAPTPAVAPVPAAPAIPTSNTNPINVPVTQAPAPLKSASSTKTAPIKKNGKTRRPAPAQPKKTIQTEASVQQPSPFIRATYTVSKKNIIRTSANAAPATPKVKAAPAAPAKPGPPKVLPAHQPAPYGLWIKTAKGSGKRPTIIALHGCGGLYSTIAGEKSVLTPRHETMVRVFTSAGFNVFLPDSFTPRGKHGNCTESLKQWEVTSQNDRVDVNAAMQWLSTRPDVDMTRIAFFGWSYGATTMISSLNLAHTDVAIRDHQPRAAIAFYPSCSQYLDEKKPLKLAAPTLILVGENDTWTPAKPCERLQKRVASSDSTITLRTYPDTYHDFDAPGTPIYVRLDVDPADGKPGGITAGGNPESRAAAYKEILTFLRDNM